MSEKNGQEALGRWQARFRQAESLYSEELTRMNERAALYKGTRKLRPLVEGDRESGTGCGEASHVRNIVFENIESQVNSAIPQPKVTARRKKDEPKAKLIENLLRNELDRLPFERMNDLMERLVPVQGGGVFLVEWDNTRRTHSTVGEVVVSALHPKQFIPQPGVFTGIEDMDYFFILMPRTREYIRRAYGKDVTTESEDKPEARTEDGEADAAPDMVTQVKAYYRNDKGGVGLFSWVNDVVLEDLEDYQARRLPRCENCGTVKPAPGQSIAARREAGGNLPPQPGMDSGAAAMAEQLAQGALAGIPAGPEPAGERGEAEAQGPKEDVCPYCGGRFTDREVDYEEIYLPIQTDMGTEIPGAVPAVDEAGAAYMAPVRVPFYKPDVYPAVLQRSVSAYGQFLGSSDVDFIKDQQNTLNRMESKVLDRLLKAGTRVTLPDRADFHMDPKDGEKWYIGNVADKQMIDVYEFKGNLEYEMMYMANVYEEARQTIGITDSFQGRRDTTATSGTAKQFSAAQAAGRLESKRAMKDAAYADLFQVMFKMWLAYADEPRPVTYKDSKGETQYEEFNRYDFLERDEAGEWYWNDEFLFSVDTASGLENNRQAMWEETLKNLQAGTFGDPAQIDTLILYWTKMELLHYPGAGETKAYLEQQKEQQVMAAQMQQQQQAQMQQAAQAADRQAALDAAATAAGGSLQNISARM